MVAVGLKQTFIVLSALLVCLHCVEGSPTPFWGKSKSNKGKKVAPVEESSHYSSDSDGGDSGSVHVTPQRSPSTSHHHNEMQSPTRHHHESQSPSRHEVESQPSTSRKTIQENAYDSDADYYNFADRSSTHPTPQHPGHHWSQNVRFADNHQIEAFNQEQRQEQESNAQDALHHAFGHEQGPRIARWNERLRLGPDYEGHLHQGIDYFRSPPSRHMPPPSEYFYGEPWRFHDSSDDEGNPTPFWSKSNPSRGKKIVPAEESSHYTPISDGASTSTQQQLPSIDQHRESQSSASRKIIKENAYDSDEDYYSFAQDPMTPEPAPQSATHSSQAVEFATEEQIKELFKTKVERQEQVQQQQQRINQLRRTRPQQRRGHQNLGPQTPIVRTLRRRRRSHA